MLVTEKTYPLHACEIYPPVCINISFKVDTINSSLGRYSLPPLSPVLPFPPSSSPPTPDHHCPRFPRLLFPVPVVASLVILAVSNLELPLSPVPQAVVSCPISSNLAILKLGLNTPHLLYRYLHQTTLVGERNSSKADTTSPKRLAIIPQLPQSHGMGCRVHLRGRPQEHRMVNRRKVRVAVPSIYILELSYGVWYSDHLA